MVDMKIIVELHPRLGVIYETYFEKGSINR